MPLHDDRALFEFLILEGAQAGLSWITILRKRPAYRAAFDNFDAARIARYGADKIESLLQDAGIVRNRLKVQAAVTNAQKFLDVQDEFGSFDALSGILWVARPGKTAGAPLRKYRPDQGIGRDEQGTEAARLQIRRHHHLLRLHAGDRHGERPHRRLFQAQGIIGMT